MIALSEGAIYPGIDVSIVSEKLRLGGHGATSIVVRIQPVTPGLKTMTGNPCFQLINLQIIFMVPTFDIFFSSSVRCFLSLVE